MRRLSKDAKMVLGVILAIGLVVCVFGRITLRAEQFRDVRRDVFLGYLNENRYEGSIPFDKADLPEWCQLTQADLRGPEDMDDGEPISADDMAVTGADSFTVMCTAEQPRVGIYGDVTLLEYQEEDRRWLDGKLMGRTVETYLKLRNPVYLRACEDGLEPEIDMSLLRLADYRFDYAKK